MAKKDEKNWLKGVKDLKNRKVRVVERKKFDRFMEKCKKESVLDNFLTFEIGHYKSERNIFMSVSEQNIKKGGVEEDM